MGHATGLLRVADIDASLAQAWDQLPGRRGLQADHYDSHSWLAAWCTMADPETVASVRIPVVLDGDQPVALLPLVAKSRHRWATSWPGANRVRHRPVLGSEEPDEEALGLLVEEVAHAGVRELSLRLPARDPATGQLGAALNESGFHVHIHQQQRPVEFLARVEGGWPGFCRRFASCQRSARKLANRLQPLWDVSVEEYGSATGAPVTDGYAIYVDLYGRSWRQPQSQGWYRYELELLRRGEALGWARVYVLRVAGVPAAAQLWLRVGDVAISLATVYDGRLAAISPGSMSEWPVQQRLFAESSPRLIDYLPGASNPLKERLGPDRAHLVQLEAARRTLVSGVTFPLRRETRALLRRAARGRTIGRSMVRRLRLPDRAGRSRVRRLSSRLGPAVLPVAALELDGPMRRFLAVAGRHPSPEAMARRWVEGDSWWRVGDRPEAIARVGAAAGPEGRPLREVIMVSADADRIEALMDALAAGVGATVWADLPVGPGTAGAAPGRPIEIHQTVLPWPRRAASAASRSG